MVRRLSMFLVCSLGLAQPGCGGEARTPAADAAPAAEPAHHLHDHRPAHGGTVAIVGPMHAEITASPDGLVRAYLNDHDRRPLDVAATRGTIVLDLPGGRRTLDLVPAADALEARTAPFGAERALALVAVEREGRRHEASVLLDLTGERAGVAGVPAEGCVPPARDAATGRTPRCVIAFPTAFTALGAFPDGARVVLTVSHGAPSVWRLPAARVELGLEPPPPVPVLVGQHEPDARAVAVRPDGTEVALALGDRVVVFDAATGRFRRALPSPGGAVQAVAWVDGARLVLAAAGDGAAHVVGAADGTVLGTIAADGQATAVAADARGRRVAVGTDVGAIVLADPSGADPPRTLAPSLEPVAGVAFAGGRLVSAGGDGVLRVFDAATGAEIARADTGTPLVRLAVAPDGRRAATADAARTLRVHRLPEADVVETLAWHGATVSALALGAGGTLVSGDNDGRLAVWDAGTAPP